MAIDNKYGKVTTEHGTIGEDEPVIVMRGRDTLLPELLEIYADMCAEAGSPQRHIDLINAAREKIVDWQDKNYSKIPDSEASRSWLD